MHLKWPAARDVILIWLQVKCMKSNERHSGPAFSGDLSEWTLCVLREVRDGNTCRTCHIMDPLSTSDPVLQDAEPSQQHAELSLLPTHLRMCYCLVVEERDWVGRWSRSHIRQTLTIGVSGAVNSHLNVWIATGGPFCLKWKVPAVCFLAFQFFLHCRLHRSFGLQWASAERSHVSCAHFYPGVCVCLRVSNAQLLQPCKYHITGLRDKEWASMQDGGIERLRETGGRGRGQGDGACTVTESIKDEKGLGRSLKGLIK